jgi:hypothetical protein
MKAGNSPFWTCDLVQAFLDPFEQFELCFREEVFRRAGRDVRRCEV